MKRVSLKVDARGAGITERELMEAQEQEAQMALQDRLLAETAKAMNDLESYVYEMRDALSTRLSAFVAESDKEALVAQLTAMEDWLYEDGMDVDKATYEAKLAELTVKVGPVVERERECDARPVALRALHAAVDKFAAFVASTDEAYAHIDSAEKEKASKEVDAAKAFLADAEAKLGELPKTSDPPVKCADIDARAASLAAVCEPIERTPKPVPKVEAAPAAPEGEAAAADGEAPTAEGDGGAAREGATPRRAKAPPPTWTSARTPPPMFPADAAAARCYTQSTVGLPGVLEEAREQGVELPYTGGARRGAADSARLSSVRPRACGFQGTLVGGT